jgi:hypothetical protein
MALLVPVAKPDKEDCVLAIVSLSRNSIKFLTSFITVSQNLVTDDDARYCTRGVPSFIAVACFNALSRIMLF